jgi:predicted GIY-YIG superfamily endonuclease
MSKYCTYVIANERGNTYVGSTNDTIRRLRQHNCEISGGAKSTRGKGPWRYVFQISCEDPIHASDHALNLSIEWHVRNPVHKSKPLSERKEFWGIEGRKKSIEKLQTMEKFKHVKFVIVLL